MSTPLLTDRRTFELPSSDMRPRLEAAIARAFGSKCQEIEPGTWRVSTAERGVAQNVMVRVEEQGNQCAVSVEVDAHRRARAKAGLAATTSLTVFAWIAAAALTFSDFRGPQAGRFLPWVVSLVMAFGLTALLLRLVQHRRVTALSAVDAIDRLWRELETLEAAPRIGRGYRIAPELAAPDDADAEALADAEQAEDDAQRVQRR